METATPEGLELGLDFELDGHSAEDQSIGNLVEQIQTFEAATLGGEVHSFFAGHPNAEGVAILDGQDPAGLIMRNDYFQKIGTLYGRDLFMHRPVKLLMNDHPLVVDVSVDIATISLIAMNRPHDQLYDMVLVTENEKFVGVVSIKRFMIELSKNREMEIKLLKNQKEILHQANEAEIRHRKQIEEKSLELRERNESIKNLMDNAGQGFMSFGKDLVVTGEYSLECVQIFRVPVGGRNFLELIAKHIAPDVLQTMSRVFESVFASAKSLKEKVYISLLPTEFSIYDKAVSIEYKIINHGGQKKMMLIATDITEKKKLETRMLIERNNVKMVTKALTKQSDVVMGIEELRRFAPGEALAVIDAAPAPKEALAEIFRLVHTFKGDFAQLGLHNTATRLHAMEDVLAALSAPGEAPNKEKLKQLAAVWDGQAILQEDMNILTDLLGKSFFEKDARFHVSEEALSNLERLAQNLPDCPERRDILAALRRLRLSPLKNLIAEYRDYLQTVAGRLGKCVEPLRVLGDDVFVDKEVWQKFIKSLVHVFRNMIDHGIETTEERLEAGKREMGQIACTVVCGQDTVSLSIADDGRGIDAGKVCRVAADKGLIPLEQCGRMSLEEVYALLFMDSFSTRDEVSALSGRGVGLAAVKAEVERLGGEIRVESHPGQGSSFTFSLPLQA